jgi:hypothetical protein
VQDLHDIVQKWKSLSHPTEESIWRSHHRVLDTEKQILPWETAGICRLYLGMHRSMNALDSRLSTVQAFCLAVEVLCSAKVIDDSLWIYDRK